MNRIEANIYRLFLEKLGSSRLSEILESLDLRRPRTLNEKAESVLRHLEQDDRELNRLIADGFDGLYHQTIFLRETTEEVENLPETSENFDIFQVRPGSTLFFVPYEMEFHVREENESFGVWRAPMKVPAKLEIQDRKLILQVLTVGNAEWDRIFNRPISRKLTTIQTDRIRDQILHHLEGHGVDVGQALDFSERARELINMDQVDTFSGTYVEFRQTDPVGSSTHRITGQTSGRQPLRTDMPGQFANLLNSELLSMSDIHLGDSIHGLPRGTRLVLYPDSGQVRLTAMIKDGDLNEFLAFLFRRS